ncbi:hypothetical protein ACTJKN_05280 [Pedobacter sp. 22163]|uniref:hypothetical protein n=1 Tax=Pedobacter sp. 22163 TaxID=3453883 RepID=UPI003F84CC39
MPDLTFDDIQFKCPACDFEHDHVYLTAEIGKDHQLYYCDNDIGGCGNKIVLQTNVAIDIKVFPFKIPTTEP